LVGLLAQDGKIFFLLRINAATKKQRRGERPGPPVLQSFAPPSPHDVFTMGSPSACANHGSASQSVVLTVGLATLGNPSSDPQRQPRKDASNAAIVEQRSNPCRFSNMETKNQHRSGVERLGDGGPFVLVANSALVLATQTQAVAMAIACLPSMLSNMEKTCV